MDGPPRVWYFSTMAKPVGDGVRTVSFHRTKYGRELWVDAAFLRDLPGFDQSDGFYRLDFHDILLVTSGEGTFELDGRVHPVLPGMVLFTRPGEVRALRAVGLDGACLFFREDFLAETFSDPHFADRFACFHPDRSSAVLVLAEPQQAQFLDLFKSMCEEVGRLRNDVSHALRARAYQLLVDLDRWYREAHGAPAALIPGLVERFRVLVANEFARWHQVSDYARALSVTPGHLNALCRRQLRRTAGALIRERLALEAKRLLRYTDLTASEVGHHLGFVDPSYFARVLKRETGLPPGAHRPRV